MLVYLCFYRVLLAYGRLIVTACLYVSLAINFLFCHFFVHLRFFLLSVRLRIVLPCHHFAYLRLCMPLCLFACLSLNLVTFSPCLEVCLLDYLLPCLSTSLFSHFFSFFLHSHYQVPRLSICVSSMFICIHQCSCTKLHPVPLYSFVFICIPTYYHLD